MRTEDILLPLVEKRLKGDFEKKNIDKCGYFIYTEVTAFLTLKELYR